MNELDILWRLGLALVLSSAIGLEREIGQKSAGLRTYSLVGVGSAVFMLVSTSGSVTRWATRTPRSTPRG